MDKKGAEFRPLYPTNLPIKEKIDIIVRQIYGGDGADYSPSADRAIEYLESIGLGGTPICMAKTQYSLTDDASKLGRPRGFRISVNEVRASAGAGYLPTRCNRSARLTAVARTRTLTSPRLGSGCGLSTRTRVSGPPGFVIEIARI